MPPLPAFLVLVPAFGAGLVAYVYSRRYGDARAEELGLTPSTARVGPTDDAGATEFDREVGQEILFGRYQTKNVKTLGVGRVARRWTLSSIVLMVLGIAILVSIDPN